jgi:PAS domain S-box-containing protein
MNDLARGFPLSRKLTLLVAGTATVALVLFAAVVLAVEVGQSRRSLVRALATQAEIIAATVAPALETGDWESAKKTLAALAARQQVVAAWLMPASPGGSVVAFDRAGQAGAPPRPAREQPYHEFAGRQLFYHMPVVAGGRWLGGLLLEADLREARMGLATYAGLVAVLLAVVLGLAWFLAARLQQVVSRPLLALAETARQVPREGGASARAHPQSDDEIGLLVNSFNEMLDRLEAGQDALRQSEERYRAVVEDQTELICRFLPDGTILFVNDAFCRFLGRSKEELVGRRWPPVAVAEGVPHFEAQLAPLSAAHPVVVIENRVRAGDGQMHWMQFVKRGVFDAQGRMTEIQAVGRDITDREEAEQALAESEMRFRQLAESIDQVFWMVDLATEQVLYISPAYERIWGRSAATLRERPQDWMEGVHPDDRARVYASFLRQRQTGCSDDEYCVVQPDGTERRVHSRAFPVRDAQGRLVRLAGIVEDVTAARLAREALEESEKRFRTLAEFVPIGIYLTGCDGECRFVNPRWCELTGLSAAEARGDGWVQALHPDDRARVQQEWTAAVRSGGEFRSEYRFRRPDGMVRWVVGGAAPLHEAGGLIVGYVGSVTDVTDRKELEQELLEIGDREQARLGQEIHDGLCQHLVSTGFSIRSLAQKLSRRELPEAALAQEVAALIDGAITLAYDLVSGLFPAQLPGEGLASALQEFLHRTSQRHGTRFSLDYPEPLELDPAQTTHLFRIAQEAVTNALKHARPGHVHLRLVDNHGLVQLSIENDGRPVSLPPPGPGGYGLRMMRHRAGLLGGTLELRHDPSGKTVVTCVFRAPQPSSTGSEPSPGLHL